MNEHQGLSSSAPQESTTVRMALEVIEELAGDDFCEELQMDRSRMRGRTRKMADKLCEIYRYAHAANDNHSCHHVHVEWRRQLCEAHQALVRSESSQEQAR